MTKPEPDREVIALNGHHTPYAPARTKPTPDPAQMTWAAILAVLGGGGVALMWSHDWRWAWTSLITAVVVAIIGAVAFPAPPKPKKG